MIKIKIGSHLLPEQHERLEDDLRDFLIQKNIKATIENTATGNCTVAFDCSHERVRWLDCEEHKGECQEVVCISCGESIPNRKVKDYGGGMYEMQNTR